MHSANLAIHAHCCLSGKNDRMCPLPSMVFIAVACKAGTQNFRNAWLSLTAMFVLLSIVKM